MRHYRVTWGDALCGHEQALEFGGREGIRDENAILSALARPYHGYHRRIHQKAAALVHGIIKNHGFVDANKRTAYYLVDLLAERSGYEIVASDEAVTGMFVSVANGETGYEELAMWFRDRLQRQE